MFCHTPQLETIVASYRIQNLFENQFRYWKNKRGTSFDDRSNDHPSVRPWTEKAGTGCR